MKLYSQLTALAALAAIGLTTVPARSADVLATHRLSAALATDIAIASIAACGKMGYAITAAVVDMDGVNQALIRGALGISGSPGKDEVCGHTALDSVSARLK